jgi:hypothetical protein
MNNGYIQITIDGNSVGLKFGYPAIKWFTEASLKQADIYFVQAEGGGFTVEGLAKLIECSYKNNCFIKETDPLIPYERFFNFVEQSMETEEGRAQLVKITEVYAESSVMKRLIDEQKKSQTTSL